MTYLPFYNLIWSPEEKGYLPEISLTVKTGLTLQSSPSNVIMSSLILGPLENPVFSIAYFCFIALGYMHSLTRFRMLSFVPQSTLGHSEVSSFSRSTTFWTAILLYSKRAVNPAYSANA